MKRAALAVSVAGWGLVGLLAIPAVLRLVAHDASFPLVALSAFTAYVFLPVWAVLVAALVTKRWWLAGASGLLALLHLVWVEPWTWVPRAEPEVARDAPRLRVMTANLLMVNHDLAGILGEIRAARPDVLLVQELAPQWADAFDTPELRARFPHRLFVAREDSFGIGIYARLPFDGEIVELEQLPYIRATVVHEGRTLTLYNVHTLPPRSFDYTPVWNRMMEAVTEMVEREPGPTLLAGDLNATPHARWYRRLVAGRLRGAHEDRGRGLATTWPNGIFPLPSIRLDHVLISDEIACLSIREGVGRGSDHRPLIADLALLDRTGSDPERIGSGPPFSMGRLAPLPRSGGAGPSLPHA